MQLLLYIHTGVVPAYSSLRCEFVCLPTHDSADSALFRLVVVNEEGEGGSDGDMTTTSGDTHNDNFLTLNTEVQYVLTKNTHMHVMPCAIHR